MDLVTVADRDLKVNTIEEQIKKRQKLILEKARDIEQTKKENKFLEHVYNDYKKYHTYILEEKKQQMEAFHILQNYLDNLINTDKISKHELENLKNDQSGILKELNTVKNELDSLIG